MDLLGGIVPIEERDNGVGANERPGRSEEFDFILFDEPNYFVIDGQELTTAVEPVANQDRFVQ